jgi:hypothetical protein
MLGMVSNYTSKKHTIIGGDLALWLNRLVENDRERKGKLFLVRYNEIGSFVIAEWLGRPRDVFVDVMNLGKSLSDFDRAKADELRKRLFEPVTADQTRVWASQVDSDYHHNLQDEDAEETERWERVARGE